jgi:hypothetical protein
MARRGFRGCFLVRMAASLGLAFVSACATRDPPPELDVADDVGRLANTRGFFGHQSVGDNILQGLREFEGASVSIAVVTEGPVAPGAIGHALVGVNGDAAKKIDDFARRVRAIDGGVDIALVKLCYADFENDVDVDQLFAHYRHVHVGLMNEFPTTQWAHMTVPLTTVESGPKAVLKSLLKKPLYGVAQNARRERFSQLIRDTWGGVGTVFDIAALESTDLFGHEVRTDDGVPVLAASYTDDGGHLNATGRRVVGAAFVKFLARLSTAKAAP